MSDANLPASTVPAAGRLGATPYNIAGYEMQSVTVSLPPGQAVMAEPGVMLYMRGDVAMNTGMSGGLMAGVKRALAGDSFFLAHFEGGGGGGEVCFAAPYPGTIHPLAIGAAQPPVAAPPSSGRLGSELRSPDGGAPSIQGAPARTEWLCQRHSFLCCSPGVTIAVALSQKLGYGLFSGEGFILQTLAGQGDALVHAGGHFIRLELAAGEQIRVDTGSVVAFESGIAYTIEFVKGFKNMMFGGEGMFFIVLTGPGTVILQSLSFDRLVSRIAAAAQPPGGGAGSTLGTMAGMGALGAVLGGVLGGGNQGGGSW